MYRGFGVTVALLLAVVAAHAQPAACPALVSQALVTVGNACGGIGRNEACYGNLSLEVIPSDSTANLDFDQAGDRVLLADIQSLHLSSLTPETNEWGVAILALQANLPDTLPGQNVIVILFGDVAMENAGGDGSSASVSVRADRPVSLYEEPDPSSPIVATLEGESQRVIGYYAGDAYWLRVVTSDGIDGWTTSDQVVILGDASVLRESAPGSPIPSGNGYGAMQAFRLRTGIGSPACSDAPADGILIQTPEGAGEVTLEINRVTVVLGSTAFVSAVPMAAMQFTLLEGTARLSVDGQTFQEVLPGETAEIILDSNGDAFAAGGITVVVSQPVEALNLPVALLERPIVSVAMPGQPTAQPTAIPTDAPIVTANVPLAGSWQTLISLNAARTTCTGIEVDTETAPFTINVIDATTFSIEDGVFTLGVDGVWRGSSPSDGSTYEFVFDGETAVGVAVQDVDFGDGPCAVAFDLNMTYSEQ